MLAPDDFRGDDDSIMNDSVLVGFLPKGISIDASILMQFGYSNH